MDPTNWNLFKVKNNNKESKAFENMCRLLFCAELDNRIGLFRYKNQTGIETEPLEKDGELYGFQSKYYDNSINKNDIIDSINKAKRENDRLKYFYLYVNKELSESSKKRKKKPASMTAVAWPRPIPFVSRVMQMEPPPMPIFTKSAPASARKRKPSSSTTLPAPTLTVSP